MANPLSKPAYALMVRKLSAGLRAHYAGQSFLVNDQLRTIESLIAELESLIVKRNRADATRVLYQRQLADRDAMWPEIHALITGLYEFLRGAHGQYNPKLADFGIQPRRRVVQTAAQKALTAAKRKATRALNATRAAAPARRAVDAPTPTRRVRPPAERAIPSTVHPRLRLLWPRARAAPKPPFS